MEDILEQLLSAEERAQVLVRHAEQEREQMIQVALKDIKTAEERFDARLPELRASMMDSAEERARQTIVEMERRYQESCERLNSLAQEHWKEAMDAAVRLLLDEDPKGSMTADYSTRRSEA